MSLDPLYRVIGWLLAFFYIPVHNIGIAIILLTVVIMLVQFPLTAKQARSMIQMQRVQPEIKKIQQKYKDDKTKQNEELLKFYQENKINPLAGCLPMIITIPIGIAVFRTFSQRRATPLAQDREDGRALPRDLRAREARPPRAPPNSRQAGRARRHAAGAPLPRCDREPDRARCPDATAASTAAIPYYVLIALVAFTGWYQVRQTQARQLQSGNQPPNAQMAAMTKIFPVFFAFICFGLNAGATLYFVVSNAWRIGQQHLVIGKLYDQAVTTGGLKSSATDDDEPPPKETNGKSPPGGNGKGATTAEGQDAPGQEAGHQQVLERRRER